MAMPTNPALISDAPAIRKPSRFERKRERILDAATDLINERGVKGMTFAEVAQTVELNTTSITYYFRLKDHLAGAVFEHALERMEAMAVEAGAEPDPQARVGKYLQLHFDLHARVLRGEERALATLSDIRALEDSVRVPLQKHYQAIFRRIRAFFGDTGEGERKALLTARAHMLTEVTFWLPAWVNHYSIGDFPRVRARLFELLAHGITPEGEDWSHGGIATLDEGEGEPAETGRGAFLRAATRLINDLGYRGASVDRIVAELKVTKGSFYHHLDAKDDLVLECFRSSYRRVSRAQHLAEEAGGSQRQRLATAIATLLDVQFAGNWPLLRTTALHALPSDVRADVVERSNRMALRFAGTLVDGISEGSIRPIDPMIASQVIMATLNAAYDLRHWAERRPRAQATAIYASTLSGGLFD
jgi:AcrR family transcriptional regulator